VKTWAVVVYIFMSYPTFKTFCEGMARHVATGGIVGRPQKTPQEETAARAQSMYLRIIDVVKAHPPFAKNSQAIMQAADALRQAMEQS
jgi:hypothetical protein